MSHIDPMLGVDLVEGRFTRTTRADLSRLFEDAEDDDHIILHVHGGLVTRRSASAAAAGWRRPLETTGRPLFVVWNSGPIATLANNLDELASRVFTKKLLAHVLAFVAKRFDPLGLSQAEVDDTDPALEKEIEDLMRADSELEIELRALVAPPDPLALRPPSLIDDDVLADLRQSDPLALPGLPWAKLAWRALKIAAKVIKRVLREPAPKRPLGAVISEEVLRSFHGEAIGGAYWAAMKGDTEDAFKPGRGGIAIVEELAAWWKPGRRISFVGHSTGAVFFSHLLPEFDARMPGDARITTALLAPACTFELLAGAIEAHGGRIDHLQIGGLSDEREGGYAEVPILYPASLLYLVSGLLEERTDMPLVGMQRYWLDTYSADEYPQLAAARARIHARQVWAPAEGHQSATSAATTHSEAGHHASVRGGVSLWLDDPTAASLALGSSKCSTVSRWKTASRSAPIHRVQPTAFAPGAGEQTLQAAVTQIDLTREIRVSTTGYGLPNAQRTDGWNSRLRATLILLQDHRGERLLLLSTDLHAGTRFLAEGLANRLSRSMGISIDRIVLGATHTHSGPGRFYGVPLYDRLAKKGLFDGFDVTWAHDLVDDLAAAAKALPGQLQPAEVAWGTSMAWGTIWQRSLTPHIANFVEPVGQSAADTRTLLESRVSHHNPPAGLPLSKLAVDPRVRTLCVRNTAHEPMAVVGWVGATPTLAPAHVAMWSADVFGAAARALQRKVGVPVGLIGSAHGDTNAVPSDMTTHDLQLARNETTPGTDEVRHVRVRRATALHLVARTGRELAAALGRAVEGATVVASGTDELSVRFDEPVIPQGKGVVDDVPAHIQGPAKPGFVLPCRWGVGDSTLAASELNRPVPSKPSQLERSDKLEPGELALQPVDWLDPQSPKTITVLGFELPLQRWLSFAKMLGPEGMDPWAPLRIASIGPSLHIVGLPAEPSVQWAQRAERELGAHLPGQVVISALCGGYAGYASTVPEYIVQDYEGASNYWGRHYGAWLRQQLLRLAQGDALARGTGADGTAWFVRNKTALPDQDEPFPELDPAALAPDQGMLVDNMELPAELVGLPLRLRGWWKPKRKPRAPSGDHRGRPIPGERWVVQIVEHDGSGWKPLVLDGAPFDDCLHEIAVWFDRKTRTWRWIAEVPPDSDLTGKTLSFSPPLHRRDFAPKDPDQWPWPSVSL